MKGQKTVKIKACANGVVVRHSFSGDYVVVEQGRDDMVMIDRDYVAGLIEALQEFVKK